MRHINHCMYLSSVLAEIEIMLKDLKDLLINISQK